MARINPPEEDKGFALNYVSTWDNVSDVVVTKIEKEELTFTYPCSRDIRKFYMNNNQPRCHVEYRSRH